MSIEAQEFLGLHSQNEILLPRSLETPKQQLLSAARLAEEKFRSLADGFKVHGPRHKKARENVTFADHSGPHFIRQGLLADNILLVSPELHVTDWRIMHAHALFQNNHDADQLNIARRNHDEIKDSQKHLNPRTGRHHQLAGALQLLAQVDLYREANNLSPEDAQQIVAFAALEILFHDSPDILKACLPHTRGQNGTKPYRLQVKANRLGFERLMFSGQELINLFEEKNGHIAGCDLLSLSPRQIIELTIYYKQKEDDEAKANALKQGKAPPEYAFIDRQATKYGLDPQFEIDFAEALSQLEGNPKQEDINTSLFMRISRSQREQFLAILGADTLADGLDQVFPSRIGLLRTLANGHARQRILYKGDDATFLTYTIDDSFDGDADVSRKKREILLIADAVERAGLENTHFAQYELPGMLIAAMNNLEKDMTTLMKGDRNAIRLMFEDILTEELLITARALLKREGMHFDSLRRDTTTPENFSERIQERLYLINNMKLHLQIETSPSTYLLQQLLDGLEKRVDDAMDAVMDPRKYLGKDLSAFDMPNGQQTQQSDFAGAKHVLVAYSQDRIEAFQRSCHEVLYGPDPKNPQRLVEFNGYKTLATNINGKLQRYNPRYLAQYSFMQKYLSGKSRTAQTFLRPYDNYFVPGPNKEVFGEAALYAA